MINLMPTEAKRQLRAARVNLILFRYSVVMVLTIIALGVVFAGSHFLLTISKDGSQALLDANQERALAYRDTQAQVTALGANLGDAKIQLDQESSYTNVLRNIAGLMPAGTTMQSLDINDAAINGSTPIEIQVYAVDGDAIVALRQNFQNSPFFTSVNVENISEDTGGVEGYPASGSMKLTLTKAVTQ